MLDASICPDLYTSGTAVLWGIEETELMQEIKSEASWSQPGKRNRAEDKQEVKWASTNGLLCELEEATETSP